jgi:cold shock CspA family protein
LVQNVLEFTTRPLAAMANIAKPPGKSVKADDSTTVISKMLSWMLRHGAKHRSVGLTINTEGWVKMADLLQTDYFKDVPHDTLMKVIVDSNSQKPRYQLSPDCVFIRAYTSQEQKTLKESGDALVGKGVAAAADKSVPRGTLRGDAPEFVPSVQAAPVAQMPMQFPGYPWPMFPQPLMPWVPTAPSRDVAAAVPGREIGRIKSFNAEKGYGFIECARVSQQYARDLFVHKAQLGTFKVGDEVSLSFTLNEHGMPQARDLKPISAHAEGKSKGKGKQEGKGKGEEKGKSKGKGKDRKGKGKDGEEETEDDKQKKGKKDGKGKGKKKEEKVEEKKDEEKPAEKEPSPEASPSPEAK